MKLLAAIAISAILSVGCGDRGASGTANADQPAAAQAPKPITQEERDAIIADATQGLKLERDKMEKISFYNTPGSLGISERLSAYLSLPDGKAPIFRIYIQYFGDSWIFFSRAKVMSDDLIVYDKEFSRSDVSRDSGSGSVWEIADFAARPDDIAAIRKIAAAKKSTIRLGGDGRRDDHELTDREVKNLTTILAAFDKLSKLGMHVSN